MFSAGREVCFSVVFTVELKGIKKMSKMWNVVIIALVVTVFGVIAFGVAYELESERDADKHIHYVGALT